MDAFVAFQRILPKHALSSFIGMLAEQSTRTGLLAPLARAAIRAFANAYDVDLREADRQACEDYENFNDFFTRALREGARPIDARADILVSPSDGRLGQHGVIHDGLLVQAKGHRYPVATLVADAEYARSFDGGYFVTIYLAPKDYHRVHTPEAASLGTARYVPGELFSVNPRTEAAVPGLFALNERLVCELHTHYGSIALTMVGALIVSGIRTPWQTGRVPARSATDVALPLERGAEIGRFQLGSTVVLCLPPGQYRLAEGVSDGATVRMGAPLLIRE